MSEKIRKKAFFILKEIAIVGVIFAVVFALSKPVNAWLGQKAIDNTGLTYLSYEEAMSLSAETGKPVMLEFSAIWCGSCRKLSNQVLANEFVREKIESEYLYARLEWESEVDKAVFDQYGVRGFPTLILIDPVADSISRLPTTFDAGQFLKFI